MNQQRLNDIRKRTAMATPGPWVWEYDKGDDTDALVTGNPTVVGGAVLWGQAKDDFGAFIRATDEDKAFIAFARSDVEYLLKVIDSLQIELKRRQEASPLKDYLHE